MRIRRPALSSLLAVSGTLAFVQTPVLGMDVATYKSLAEASIEEVSDGAVDDVDILLVTQDQLIELGVEGARDFAAEHPESSELLTFVADRAESMKALNLVEIEAQWHELGALKEAGIDASSFEHYGPVMSTVDAIIHPATAHIALSAYKTDQKPDRLEQVVDELSEVLEHLDHL